MPKTAKLCNVCGQTQILKASLTEKCTTLFAFFYLSKMFEEEALVLVSFNKLLFWKKVNYDFASSPFITITWR